MSQAPLDASEDPTTVRNTAFREANARQQELLRNGVSNSGHERNCCHLNTGMGRFANVSAAAGMDHIGDGRAYALVDWDHDGDVDVWATNRTGPRVQFLRNNGGREHHFLVIKLLGNGSTTNRDAVGARVELVLQGSGSGAGKSIKTVRAGEGFLGQSSKSLHFGLGSAEIVDRLIVHWPGAEAEEFTDVTAGHHYEIVQGSGVVRPWSRPGDVQPLAASANTVADSKPEARIPLRYRVPLPTLQYETMDGSRRSIGGDAKGPTLVNLWASWCHPCVKELVDLRADQSKWRKLGLEIVALSVDRLAEDSTSDPQAARSLVEMQQLPFFTGFAEPNLTGRLEAALYYLFDFRRGWNVPTSFLLDRHGRLAVIYIGPIEMDQLSADVEALALDEQEWLEASLPFAGRWVSDSRHPNLLALITTFFDQGFEESAIEYVDRFEQTVITDPDFPKLFVRIARALRAQGDHEAAARRLRQVVEATPDHTAARFELGRVLLAIGDPQESVGHLEHAVATNPDTYRLHFALATALVAARERERAITHFRRSLALQPASVPALNALAWMLATDPAATAKEGQEAVSLAEDAAQRTSHEHPKVLDTLAASYAAAGEFDQAVSTAQRAIEIALASGSAELAHEIGQHLERYRVHQPYREALAE